MPLREYIRSVPSISGNVFLGALLYNCYGQKSRAFVRDNICVSISPEQKPSGKNIGTGQMTIQTVFTVWKTANASNGTYFHTLLMATHTPTRTTTTTKNIFIFKPLRADYNLYSWIFLHTFITPHSWAVTIKIAIIIVICKPKSVHMFWISCTRISHRLIW